jgi:hypothetical protein
MQNTKQPQKEIIKARKQQYRDQAEQYGKVLNFKPHRETKYQYSKKAFKQTVYEY